MAGGFFKITQITYYTFNIDFTIINGAPTGQNAFKWGSGVRSLMHVKLRALEDAIIARAV